MLLMTTQLNQMANQIMNWLAIIMASAEKKLFLALYLDMVFYRDPMPVMVRTV